MGWGSSPKPPPAPDYKAQAEATAKSNQQAQTQADWANRPDVNTAWGKESWASHQEIDPSTGQAVTKWTMNQTLDPQQQAALDAQMAVQTGKSQLAQDQMGRVSSALQNPFDWSSMQAYGDPGAAGGLDPNQFQTSGAGEGIMRGLDPNLFGDAGRQRYEQALFDRMAPQHQQAQAALDAKMANMGATAGSKGWQTFNQQLGDQQSRERFNALEAGGNEQQRQYQMALGGGQFQNAAQQQAWQQAMGQNQQNFGIMAGANQQNFGQNMGLANYQNNLRQQQIAEQMQQRQMPLNELNALMSGQQVGQLQTPNFNQSRSTGGVDYSGAAQDQYGAQTDAYNAQVADKNAMMSGIASMAGMAGMVVL
jgi:hypothetical protein